MADEKKFVDDAGLKQVMSLIKGLIKSNYTTLDGKITEQTTSALETLESIKSNLETKITEVQEASIANPDNSVSDAEIQAMFNEAPVMVDADGNVTEVTDIATAVSTATSGTTIVLGADVTLPAGTEIAEGITLDLNGFTLEVA